MGGSRRDYDVIVLGGGSAGLAAAAMAGILGAKTALLDPQDLGGECTWTGCIPSKSLLRAAHAAHEMSIAAELGLEARLTVDFAQVMERIRRVRSSVYELEDAPPRMARYGVETIRAAGRFVDRHTVELDGEGPSRLTARWFVIATGSRPMRLDVEAPTVDNETMWDLDRLPGRLLIAGGGPVAIETAQAFRRLGSEVTVVSADSRILPRDDEECAAILQRQLVDEGVRFAFGCELRAARNVDGTIAATLSNDHTLDADVLFSAIGREARVEGMCLDNAGVEVRDGRVWVDAHCRTTARNIYACGDVATTARFTHVAERMSTVAMVNAVLKIPVTFHQSELTWATFTDPELAQVGPNEAELGRRGRRYTVLRFPFDRLDRAITDAAPPGLVKILASRTGRILGATIVGARAGDTIAELALARKHRLTAGALSGTLHAYPTYAMAVRRSADAFVLRRRTDFGVRVLRLLRGLRGTAPPLDTIVP
jgi:pyruvate/2-oxoglutarate dehydrogenase complex dihydrolipoamide dehydrogenase (E3) component